MLSDNAIKLTSEQLKRVAELRRMTPKEWEALCKRCGMCCLIKLSSGFKDVTLYTDFCCEHLDCSTKACKIYKKRIEAEKGECQKVNLDIVLKNELLPASCGYVEYIFGPAKYPAKVDFSRVQPIKDKDFDEMPQSKVLNHILTDSINWQR